MKVIAVDPSIELYTDQIDIVSGANNITKQFCTSKTAIINLQLQAIEENGELFRVMKPEKWYKASYEDDINDNRERRDNNE